MPHDRMLVAYVDEHARTYTVFAEEPGPGPPLHVHRERYRRQRLQAVSALAPILGGSLRVDDLLERLGDALRPSSTSTRWRCAW